MFFYFGYGSNLSVISLRAKGVNALRSIPAILEGWQLRFNVPDFFRIEGGTGNIQPCDGSVVHGVLHDCRDSELEALDRLEALGYTYRREELLVSTYDGQRKLAYAYVGLEPILDHNLLPSERYRNILVRGAVDMKLDPSYIERLRATPTLVPPNHGPFEAARAASGAVSDLYTQSDLASHRHLTALAGVVFDLSKARPEHAYLKELFGGRDVTLLFLRRMDTSDGSETFDDVRFDRLSEGQRRYLNSYLHEFAREYRVAGHMNYDVSPPSGGFVAVGAPVSLRWAGRRPSQMAPRPSSMPRPVRAPSRDILRRADVMHEQLGNENTGFLSAAHGFLPRERPRLALPRDYLAWDQAAASLPDMYRSLRLRSALDRLPLLDASTDDLPDEDLLRAGAVLAMLSHAYWYVETRPPAALPEALATPWAQVRARLGRAQAVLTYIDLIVYNWRLVDPARRDPMRIDNMRLLIPTVDTNEERTFYLTQTEILAQAAPVIEAVVRAQEAVIADDRESLESQLLTILGCLEAIRESLLNINPNPRSVTYVDPVIWAKTVAPFAVPLQEGVQGPSGTSSPIINLLDIFLGRKKFETFLGREIAQLRQTYPRLWRDFLVAVGDVSVSKYIEESRDPNLSGLLHETLAVYAGPNGFLGRHRMKVYGYIEIAFKVGRSVTIGGFKGVFKDRTWQRVDAELEMARHEREQILQGCHYVRVVSVTPDKNDPRSDAPALEVLLDVSGTGMVFEPGDRCGILPESDDDLVQRTLDALGASGDEEVPLNDEWRGAIRQRSRYRGGAAALPLREILRFGVIRPVVPRAAEALYELTKSELLKGYVQQGVLHRFELWDLLLELRRSGVAVERLWNPDGITPSSAICRIVPPETFRMYSLASTMSSAETGGAQHIRLSVSRLVYYSEPAGGGAPIARRGTASSFLGRAAKRDEPVSLILHHPPRFGLPRHAQTPIVMIAGGTGLSPFRGFIAERLRQPAAGAAWLMLGLRSREHFVYADELAPAVRSGLLKLDLAFSREDIDLRWGPTESGKWAFVEVPGRKRRVPELMLEDETARPLWEMLTSVEQGACVYVCGRSRFARSVLDAIKAILRRFATGSEEARDAGARELLCKMVAEGRLMFEIYSGHTEDDPLPDVHVSELAWHNDDRHGYWAAIDGKVYDLTEYVRLHPGGTRILQAYAGMDASDGYARSHAHRSEIDAVREMYVCGRIKRVSFVDHARVIDGPDGPTVVSLAGAHRAWTAFLYLIVEMQNALRSDQALQDGITAWGDPVRPRSPYKLQRAAETHERFLRNYLDLLINESIPNMWAISHGLFDFAAEPTWMRKQLAMIQSSYGALYTEAILKELYQFVQGLIAPSKEVDERATLAVTCEVLEEQAVRLLEDLKEFVIAGLQVFEGLGGNAPSQDDERLLMTCVAIPDRIQSYYDDVAARLHFMGWGSPVSEQLAATR